MSIPCISFLRGGRIRRLPSFLWCLASLELILLAALFCLLLAIFADLALVTYERVRLLVELLAVLFVAILAGWRLVDIGGRS